MALVYLETPNLLHEILLFIPLVWVKALRWNSKPSQGPCLPQQIWNTGGHGQGVYKVGVFPWLPTEVSVNTDEDETITGSFRFWPFGDFLSHLLTLSIHVYCFGNKQLWDEGWDLNHPTWFYLGKWSISINLFIAQTLTDFRKLHIQRTSEPHTPLGDLQVSWKLLWFWMSVKSEWNTSYQTVSKSKYLEVPCRVTRMK